MMLLLDAILRSEVLALEPTAWRRLLAIMERDARGALSDLDLRAAVGDRAAPSRTRGGGAVAVLPVVGLLFHRGDVLASLLGWRSMSEIARDIRALAADPSVRAIMLDVDSPGGEVPGVQELADVIAQARQRKPALPEKTRQQIAARETTLTEARRRVQHATRPALVLPDGTYRVYAHGPRIELFARQPATGRWVIWGNEP